MLLHPKPTMSTRFTWIGDERMFVADLSDIGFLDRVYDDACDVGLTLISRYDGREMVFVVSHVERGGEDWRDNEILWWDLEPARLELRRPGRVPFRVRVLND